MLPLFRSQLRRWITALMVCAFFTALAGCDQSPPPEPAEKPQMLIYCGITMIKPMLEIARMIEDSEKISIVITKGGSGNLMKSLIYSKTGDLYLPGSDKYYQTLDSNNSGTILEKVLVGHNRAAMMVQKGNPRNISNDLENLTRKEYAVVIGNADSGSIGRETRVILERKGIYDAVLQNTMKLTTDSKDLVKVLVTKEADLVINWHAVSTWEENQSYMDVLYISPEFAGKKNLVLGLLKFSQNPAAARKFMALASSETGRAIFKKYGLYFE